ncbi:unnamed protein product [Paramecium primaurelia]|uniref:Uncharacterized protein n=1 Tax=Paramecium primaurelia TaxID=5886 RepID=A0A8S1PUQ3_PARPR|nr:unnamed protein product [Paramecium primaurelia]
MYGETGQGEFQDSLLPKKVKINFNQKHIIIDDFYVINYKGNQSRRTSQFIIIKQRYCLCLWICITWIIRSRINFLEQRRIKQLFAGGNHSWALIDYNQPRIDDYSPPSPLNEEAKIENITQPLDQGIQDLEIVITEVKMHHRFVKIQVPAQFQTTNQAKINDYLNFMQKDPNTKLSKIQNDALALGVKEENNKLSFTIMMVMDLSSQKMPFEDMDEGKVNQIGKQFLVKRSTFNKNSIYDWIIQAEKIMNIPGISIKFLELRPLQ